VRGYDKRRVEDYAAWLREQLSAAQGELADAHRELAAARDESVALQQQLQNPPRHEHVSARMAEILRLAQEEAEQEREKAAHIAAGIHERTQVEAREVVNQAQLKATDMVRDTRRCSEDALTVARQNAKQLIETARDEADATLAQARERSQRVLNDTDRRSRQIMALQQRRLTRVVAAHKDSMRWVEVASTVINGHLAQDREQGHPAAQVDPEVLPTLGPALDSGDVDLSPRPHPSPSQAQQNALGSADRPGTPSRAAEETSEGDSVSPMAGTIA
jgi:cell division septum initiation protein DivIVA